MIKNNLICILYMDYYQKYIKYKNKYLKMQKISGGSYIINSNGITEHSELIIYPEVSILIDKKIGEGGIGSVTKGMIIKCSKNPKLIGKTVAIKSFFKYREYTSENMKKYEKDKMLQYHLDEDNSLIENPYITSLYFDITSGPLKDCLIYEYGGNTLCSYIGSFEHNLENNKRIMKQLFTILYELAQRDNMHNDIHCGNILYNIDSNNNVNIKLIDFDACERISEFNNKSKYFGRNIRMNTPETIYNHLKNSSRGKYLSLPFEHEELNNFNRWYYFPFISIVYLLFTGIEYSTSNTSYIMAKIKQKDDENINKLITQIGTLDSKEKWKLLTYNILLNNDTYIKKYLEQNIYEKFREYFPILNTLIDEMCKPIPSTRMSEDSIIELLSN